MSRTTVTSSGAQRAGPGAPRTDAPILPAQHPAPPRRVSRHLTGWVFAGPATLIVVGLSIFPALWAFFLSRQNWDGITPADVVGLDATTTGWPTTRTCAARSRTRCSSPRCSCRARSCSGMLLATALNRPIRFVGFYRTAIFVPFVASAAATGILANFVFNPQFGVGQQRCCGSRTCRSSSSSRAGTRPCS